MAQSSVSEQIARLERHLGHSLLERSPAGVRATGRGTELAARIAGPVDALAAATAQSDGDQGEKRIVFLGGPAEFLSDVVLPALARHLPPEVRVAARVAARFGLAEDLIDALRDGTIDVLVSTLPVRVAELSCEPAKDGVRPAVDI